MKKLAQILIFTGVLLFSAREVEAKRTIFENEKPREALTIVEPAFVGYKQWLKFNSLGVAVGKVGLSFQSEAYPLNRGGKGLNGKFSKGYKWYFLIHKGRSNNSIC